MDKNHLEGEVAEEMPGAFAWSPVPGGQVRGVLFDLDLHDTSSSLTSLNQEFSMRFL